VQNKKIFLALILLPISFIPVFAQSETCDVIDELICVDVADGFYEEGDTVVVSGKVKAVIQDNQVSLQIFYDETSPPTFIEPRQIQVAQDGTFATTIIARGPMWQKDGTYLVRASYLTNIAETSFEFKTKGAELITTDVFDVDAGSFGTFDVPYTINGGTIKNIIVEPKILGLIVTIDTARDGLLTLDLPRSHIDAKKSDGTDEKYIIFIDGAETSFEETFNINSRIIKLNFKKGDSTIEIIGTFVVPEFGSYIILTLLLSFVTLIIIQQKNKFLIKI